MRTTAPQKRASSAVPPRVVAVDQALAEIARTARVLPALVASNAVEERRRLIDAVTRDAPAVPRWELGRPRQTSAARRSLAQIASVVEPLLPATLRALYLARIDELEVDLAILDALGDPRVRALAARRYGRGDREVLLDEGAARLSNIARGILSTIGQTAEACEVPAEGRGSLAGLLRRTAASAGLELEVRVEPRLTAGAATGDRVVYVAARHFGRTEARRLAAHEVLGHAVAAANARRHALRLLEIGTAGSFADQEGLAIALEERAGALDGARMRTLAARVIVTERLHQGASFADVARGLVKEHGFEPESAVAIAERAFRGGGVARDASYLWGWLRVSRALARGETSIDALRVGRVSLDDAPALAELTKLGWIAPPLHAPTLDALLADDLDE